MNDFGSDYPPGVTAKMIDDLYKTEMCRTHGVELNEEGICTKCSWEDSLYEEGEN